MGSRRVPSATPRFPAQSSHWAPLRSCLPRSGESSPPSSVRGLGWRILKPRLSGAAPWFFPAQSPPRAAHAWGSLTRSAALQMGPAARGCGLQGVVTEPARPAASRAVYGYCASGKGHEAGQARGGSTLVWLPEQGLLLNLGRCKVSDNPLVLATVQKSDGWLSGRMNPACGDWLQRATMNFFFNTIYFLVKQSV